MHRSTDAHYQFVLHVFTLCVTCVGRPGGKGTYAGWHVVVLTDARQQPVLHCLHLVTCVVTSSVLGADGTAHRRATMSASDRSCGNAQLQSTTPRRCACTLARVYCSAILLNCATWRTHCQYQSSAHGGSAPGGWAMPPRRGEPALIAHVLLLQGRGLGLGLARLFC